MTDERSADPVASARRLPPGSGIVFRHYATAPADRRRLFAALLRVARARRLVLLRAGNAVFRGEMGQHGHHSRRIRGRGAVRAGALAARQRHTVPVHDAAQAAAARRAGATPFVSPIFLTRSHPGAPPLARHRAGALVRAAGGGAIALGGMDARRFRAVRSLGFAGWAAIDALA